jgi:hypothetical protein
MRTQHAQSVQPSDFVQLNHARPLPLLPPSLRRRFESGFLWFYRLPFPLSRKRPHPLRSPPTALAMLEEFETLKAGDSVAQNGATSAVGEVG